MNSTEIASALQRPARSAIDTFVESAEQASTKSMIIVAVLVAIAVPSGVATLINLTSTPRNLDLAWIFVAIYAASGMLSLLTIYVSSRRASSDSDRTL